LLGEYFVDSCIVACCSVESTTKHSKEIFNSIKEILNSYKINIKKEDITVDFESKLNCLSYICDYRLLHKKFDFLKLVDSISTGKGKDLVPILESRHKELNEEEVKDLASMIFSKRKLFGMMDGKVGLEDLINDLNTGNFIDDEEVITKWDSNINVIHSNMQELKRIESVDNITTLDLVNDDWEPVFDEMRNSVNPSETVTTGYSILQQILPCGGFEPRRLYLIGGTSGVGKSTLLANLICNGASAVPQENIPRPEHRDTYVYLTAENLIHETLSRLCCCLTGETVTNLNKKIFANSAAVKEEVIKILNSTYSNIKLCYFKPHRTTISELESLVANLIDEYNVKAVYLDYLDLIRGDRQSADLRLELGDVAVGLKSIAVDFKIPVITVTQLNREGYNTEAAPSLTQMSESMRKIDNSDFVLFVQNAANPQISIDSPSGVKTCKHIKMTSLKNRNGPVGLSGYSYMVEKIGSEDYFNYKIEEFPKISKKPKNEESKRYSSW